MMQHQRISSGAVRRAMRGAIGVALLAALQPAHLYADQLAAHVVTWSRTNTAILKQNGPYYLALGDGFTAGARMNGPSVPGFAHLFFRTLKAHGVKAMLNLACPGDTTQSFIAGGCPVPSAVPNRYHGYPAGSSQLKAALAFIHAHPGRVRYVTFHLGYADIYPDPSAPWCRLPTLVARQEFPALDTNLHTILSRLRAALGSTGQIIVLNYYDPWQNRCAHVSTTRASSIFTLNRHIARAAASFHMPVADLYTAFNNHSTPNPQLCHLTYVCTAYDDPSPTPAGHVLIASVLARLVK